MKKCQAILLSTALLVSQGMTAEAAFTVNVAAGTTVTDEIVEAGIQHISDGGEATDSIVGSGGKQFVDNNGTINNTRVLEGGWLLASGPLGAPGSKGGIINGADIQGGMLTIYSSDVTLENISMSDGDIRYLTQFKDGQDWNQFNFTGDTTLTGGTFHMLEQVGQEVFSDNITTTFEKLSGSDTIFRLQTDLASSTDGSKIVVKATDNDGSQEPFYLGVYDASLKNGQAAQGKLLLVTDETGKLNFAGKDLFNGGLWVTTPEITSETAGGGKNWYLNNIEKKMTGDTAGLFATNEVAYAALVRTDTMRQRLGELRAAETEKGLWARITGGKLKGSAFSNSYQTYQLGYDVKAGAGNDWIVGGAFEYAKGSVSYDAGSGDNKMAAVALYGTRKGVKGDNIDLIVKHGEVKGDLNTHGLKPDSADYSSRGTTFSLEYNKHLAQDNGTFFEPQVQLTLGHLGGDNYTTDNGTQITTSGMNSAIARLGFAVGKNMKNSNVYFKASALHEFGGKGDISMLATNGEVLSENVDYGDTWVELGIGTNIKLSKANNLYLDVERSFGAKLQKQWQVNAGIRLEF